MTSKSKLKRRDSKRSKKSKKTKEQLDAERKQREADRARRDAERAKKRLALKVKIMEQKKKTQQQPPATPSSVARIEAEQRKKILQFRKNQGRFGLPVITATPLPNPSNSALDNPNGADPRASNLSVAASIPEANDTDNIEKSPWDNVDHSLLNGNTEPNTESNTEPVMEPQVEVVESENDDPNLSNADQPENTSLVLNGPTSSDASKGSDGVEVNPEEETLISPVHRRPKDSAEEEQAVDTEDEKETEKQGDSTNEVTNQRVEPLLISAPIEPALSRSLSTTSWTSLEDFALTQEQEDALGALEKGLEAADPDFYGFVQREEFMQILKENEITVSKEDEPTLMSACTLIDDGVDYYAFTRLIREVGRTVLPDYGLHDICQEIVETEKNKQTENKEDLPSTNIAEINSDDLLDVDEAEFQKFLQKAEQGSDDDNPQLTSVMSKGPKLDELIEDLALDGASIDFALLKMALQTIDCHPPEKDLKFLVNHLCADGSGFVDFNYLITFLQETSRVPARKWTRIEKIISKVVNQIKIGQRAEARRRAQAEKLKQRLEKKRASRMASGSQNKDSDALAKVQAEEKRLRALKLRDKAKMLK